MFWAGRRSCAKWMIRWRCFTRISSVRSSVASALVSCTLLHLPSPFTLRCRMSRTSLRSLLGLWATKKGCAAFGITNPGGAVAGNGRQVGLQIAGACFIIGWNVVWTSLIMAFIKYVCRVPLRMPDAQLEIGDFAIHGEEPYTFEYYNRKYVKGLPVGYEHEHRHGQGLGDEEKGSGEGSSNEGVLMGKDPHEGRGEGEITPTKGGVNKQD